MIAQYHYTKTQSNRYAIQLNSGDIVYSINTVAVLVNHSCAPNAILEEDDRQRLFILAKQNISVGSEISYDYNGSRRCALWFTCQCKKCKRKN